MQATNRQIRFLMALMDERAVPDEDYAAMRVGIGRGLDSTTASSLIRECQSYPRMEAGVRRSSY